jgi:hypothetical protein
MYKFANTLLTKLAACEHVTVAQSDYDADIYDITVDLGTGYANKDWAGGLWADTVRITDDSLKLEFSVLGGDNNWNAGDEDALDYCIGEGVVRMHYADYGSGNLAYTSALEDAINDAIQTNTNGLVYADGSEQGMQGYDAEDECYLSLDLEEWLETDPVQTEPATATA